MNYGDERKAEKGEKLESCESVARGTYARHVPFKGWHRLQYSKSLVVPVPRRNHTVCPRFSTYLGRHYATFYREVKLFTLEAKVLC